VKEEPTTHEEHQRSERVAAEAMEAAP
jgi:hypothetical protein